MNNSVQDLHLLAANDPCPVEWVNPDSPAPVLLVCEHAGQEIPQSLGTLGLPEGAIHGHIGWDIGAEALARKIAQQLNAPLILQRYSRLVIDCNRPPGTAGSVPLSSDGTTIPDNRFAEEGDRSLRTAEIFRPLDQAFHAGFDRHTRRAAFSIHSFTAQMQGMPARPWHAGFVSRRDLQTATTMMDSISKAAPDLLLALNEPYQIEDETDWFIPQHAERRGVAHTLIEVQNGQLGSPEGIDRWAGLLSNAIEQVLETLT